MTWTVPNILTVARLAAAPGLALAFLFLPRPAADWIGLTLFVLASATDWIDGYLARAWDQMTKLGTMLDPIADKAMVVIALTVLAGLSGMNPWIVLPAILIVFREIFVSGLREFLGDTAGTLAVTKLAKWKTAAQMTAIAVILINGLFEHYYGMAVYGLGVELASEILAGREEDLVGLGFYRIGYLITAWGGFGLLWIAALLTLITGWDYLRKATPYLKDSE